MSFNPNDLVIIRIDQDGNTNQELLSSEIIPFESGINISGGQLTINGFPALQVTESGDITFGCNVFLEIPSNPISGTSAVSKNYVDTNLIETSGYLSLELQELAALAIASGNLYTNLIGSEAVTSGYNHTNTAVSTLSGYVDAQDAAAVASGQAYTDTAAANAVTSGQTYTNTQIASYSGYAEGAFVNISGDTMTGFLTLSSDPTLSGHAATKQYVDSRLETRRNTFAYPFGVDGNGLTTNSTNYTTRCTIFWPGTNTVGSTPVEGHIVTSMSANSTGWFRIYDITNATTVAEMSFTNRTKSIVDLGDFSNVSDDEAMWELQLKRGSGPATIRCHSLTFLC